MSFSLGLKQEILSNRPMRARYRMAQAYGLFLFGRAFDAEEISLYTEIAETAALFQQFVGDLIGKQTPVKRSVRRRGVATVFGMTIPQLEDRQRLLDLFGGGSSISCMLLETPAHIGAFLAGAYLACGNMSDPQKSYHMEFVVRDHLRSRMLWTVLDEIVPGARIGRRGQCDIVYYKECAAIEDVMTLMGATRSCLAMIDIETFKSVRNRANRAVNCETANIDKLVGAAAAQIEDIQFLLRIKGEEGLPDPLRSAAQLRLDHPEASLRELAELSPEPISRSGIHHRLGKLTKMAAALRADLTGGGKTDE